METSKGRATGQAGIVFVFEIADHLSAVESSHV